MEKEKVTLTSLDIILCCTPGIARKGIVFIQEENT